MPLISGAADLDSGTSTTRAPIVMAVPAIEAALSRATRVTRAGSTMPADLRSTSLAGLLTSIPCPALPARTWGSHSSAFRPALVSRILNGCSRASFKMVLPAATDVSSLAEAVMAEVRLMSVTPPPGTMPSSRAALTAWTASSTRNFFSPNRQCNSRYGSLRRNIYHRQHKR